MGVYLHARVFLLQVLNLSLKILIRTDIHWQENVFRIEAETQGYQAGIRK